MSKDAPFGERCINCLEDSMQVILRGIGPLFVGFAVALITFIAYIHFVVFLPDLMSIEGNGLAASIHYLISFILLFNLTFNYFMVIRTPPGETPRESDYTDQQLEAFNQIKVIKKSESFTKFCVTCRLPKMDRAHHCQISKARGELYKNPYDNGCANNFNDFFNFGMNRSWWMFAVPTFQTPSSLKKNDPSDIV
ncbi:DHHC zinc finger domain-containing protein [Heterostelium album PN500]|uniref:DHHC zinc finger domain-containing protein n=1 Tax=Heterostelium pallidum (strain ATCC 26659 / Pp 5 / PN500) TaxID=670386 RepID=D3BS61_HETP5|nr:DHHC zinc finger domain-containing protein [Heterostelium album PN500]EFA75798.1 DHHC zinc finger domain-containing protein [Heterostelium album PN500]|eukprot:XP_020427932.1 DHHC zinc finger domain-containing protein [Heterostelium album PN500]